MYELLQDIARRPQAFSRYTTKELWTRPHLARQMLDYHLNQDTDLGSRRLETIDRIVDWIDLQLQLPRKRLCDLGCGPGLYTRRFADCGAAVTGVDFSQNSLDYARRKASEQDLPITYLHADYLEDELPKDFDIVTLIYTDYCVLSPAQRASLLARIREMLKPGGQLVMDVAGIGSFTGKQEHTHIEKHLMGGFWAESDYVGIQRTYIYPDAHLSLDRYVIIEPDEPRQIFNWFQHFSPERLRSELEDAGYAVEEMAADLTGAPLQPNSDFIGVIASV
jgi:SAM-dependent methyltransferase